MKPTPSKKKVIDIPTKDLKKPRSKYRDRSERLSKKKKKREKESGTDPGVWVTFNT